MRVNYKQLSESYEKSGQTMKEFGKARGMSSSMVSYYLKKARTDTNILAENKFSEIELSFSKTSSVIKIRTSKGVLIEIPI